MLGIKWLGRLGLVAMVLLLGACSDESPQVLTPAPLGDRAVLQKLADAYTELSDEKLAVSPMNLLADERHDFVTQVFARAGYSYSATLSELASDAFDKNNPLHRDMAELVLMPHHDQRLATMKPAEIYTSEELMDVAVIERKLNQ